MSLTHNDVINEYRNTGSTRYAITFEYDQVSQVKVRTYDTNTNEYTYVTDWEFDGATAIRFTNVVPDSFQILRETDISQSFGTAKYSTFVQGGAIRATDLNGDFELLRQSIEEGHEVSDDQQDQIDSINDEIDSIQDNIDEIESEIDRIESEFESEIDEIQSELDSLDGKYVNVTGDTMTGQLAMSNQKITSLGSPEDAADAVNKQYVDGILIGSGGNISSLPVVRYIIKAGGGETVLDPIAPIAPGNEIVTVNGSTLTPSDDYTVTSDRITLKQPLLAGDEAMVLSYNSLKVVEVSANFDTFPYTRWVDEADAGQTVFTGNGSGTLPLAYSPGFESVFLNGALLTRDVDYGANDRVSIILAQGAVEGDVIDVHSCNYIQTGTVQGAGGITYTYPGSGVEQTVQQRLEQYVSVKDFGAVGDGVTDDTDAIQAAINYLATQFPSHMNDSGASLYFPSGDYYVTSTINVPSTFDGAGFFGDPGKGSKITTDADIVVFMVGEDLSGNVDAATSAPIYHTTFSNLFFVNYSVSDNAVAIQLNRMSLGGISDCAFYGWYKHVVCYRANQWEITNCQFRVTARRTNAECFLELNGVYDSSNSYTPGGGLHITDCEFWGGGYNNIQNVIKVNSVDGLYITQCHTTGGIESSLSVTPAGTIYSNTITDIRVINTYFDNAIGQTQHVFIGGAVTSNTRLYQDIFFSTCKFRGTQGGTSNCVKIAVDASSIGTYTNLFKEVSFDQCEFLQAGIRGLIVEGAGNTRLEVENLIVSNCFFGNNNYNNVASLSGGDAFIEARGVTITGCNFDTSQNPLRSSVQLNLSGATAVNQSLVLTSNNFAKVDTTDGQPYRIPIAKGMRTVVSDNTMPQAGTTIDDTYTTSTTGYAGGQPFLFNVATTAPEQTYLIYINASAASTNGTNKVIASEERYVIRTTTASNLSDPHQEVIYRLNNLTSNKCPIKLILLNGGGNTFQGDNAYSAGDYFVSASNIYLCITSGTSSASAPTHTSGAQLNGSARFIYVAPEDVDALTVFVSGDSGVDLDWSVDVKLVSAN